MRVTIDLDSKCKKRLRKIARRLAFLTDSFPEIRKSSGGKGYHLIVRDLDISYEKSVFIRYRCGDDLKRIHFDIEGVQKPRQILWSAKQILLGDRSGEKGFSEVISYGH